MSGVFSAFQKSKIERIIRANNKRYLVTRYGENDYGERTEELNTHFLIPGLFHDRQGFTSITESDATTIQHSMTPMLLVLIADCRFRPIAFEDVIKINNRSYRVLNVNDIGEANFAYDISLELIE